MRELLLLHIMIKRLSLEDGILFCYACLKKILFILVLHFNTIPLYGCFILSFGTGLIVALITYFVFVPYLKRKIDKEFELEDIDSQLVDDKNIQKGIFKKKKKIQAQCISCNDRGNLRLQYLLIKRDRVILT